MKVIVGLGNVGASYAKTRHNAGFMVVDRLAERHAASATPRSRFSAAVVEFKLPRRGPGGGGSGVGGGEEEQVLLLKPTTMMNLSGRSVAEAVRFYKLDPARDLLVVVDDLYLPCGTIRLRPGGGAAGHNGLADIQRSLGTETYPRLRVGIDPKPPFMDQADYVLGRFTDEQWGRVTGSIDRAADACEVFATRGLDAAMNAFNAPEKPPSPRRTEPGDRPPTDPKAASQDQPPRLPPGAARPSSGESTP